MIRGRRPSTTLELRGFGAKRRRQELSDPLHLRLHPGTVLGVVGPNGVGKSSLLGAIAHTGVSTYGEAFVRGRSLGDMTARERAQVVSFMAQGSRGPAEFRVQQIVEVGAKASGQRDVTQTVNAALERVGVPNLTERPLGSLSGGQQQLVQFARVLAQDTPIVTLDEPTSALDLHYQRVVESLMQELGAEQRIVIAAIHDLSIALNACTHVLLLYPDRSTCFGEPAEVLSRERVYAAYGVPTSIHTTTQGRQLLAHDV